MLNLWRVSLQSGSLLTQSKKAELSRYQARVASEAIVMESFLLAVGLLST